MPNTELAAPEFGAGPLTTTDFVIARAGGLVTNGSGYLGNTYNFPSTYTFDASQNPGLPGAFAKTGYNETVQEMVEHIAVDPNRLYRLGAYIRQEGVAGDWSGFTHEDRHIQHMGFRCYDADGLAIDSGHHHV